MNARGSLLAAIAASCFWTFLVGTPMKTFVVFAWAATGKQQQRAGHADTRRSSDANGP